MIVTCDPAITAPAPEGAPPFGYFFDKSTGMFATVVFGQIFGITMSPQEAHGMALALLEYVAMSELTSGLSAAVPAGQA